jgi:hypothetical protein
LEYLLGYSRWYGIVPGSEKTYTQGMAIFKMRYERDESR